MTGAQIRAARELVGWSAQKLAEACKVSLATIQRAEKEKGPTKLTTANAQAIRHALEDAGALFIEDEHMIGAALRKVPAALALLLALTPAVAFAEPAGSVRQACLSPAEMAALLPASREQAEDFCEASDARALERVRAVLRLLGAVHPADGTPTTPVD